MCLHLQEETYMVITLFAKLKVLNQFYKDLQVTLRNNKLLKVKC